MPNNTSVDILHRNYTPTTDDPVFLERASAGGFDPENMDEGVYFVKPPVRNSKTKVVQLTEVKDSSFLDSLDIYAKNQRSGKQERLMQPSVPYLACILQPRNDGGQGTLYVLPFSEGTHMQGKAKFRASELTRNQGDKARGLHPGKEKKYLFLLPNSKVMSGRKLEGYVFEGDTGFGSKGNPFGKLDPHQTDYAVVKIKK